MRKRIDYTDTTSVMSGPTKRRPAAKPFWDHGLTFPSIIMICARPRSGKSHAIKSIIYSACKQGRFNHGIVFCPSAYNGDYDFMPQDHIYGYWDEEVLKRFVQRQEALSSRDRPAPPAFVILDDLVGSVKWNSDFMKSTITRYRHFNTTFIIASQYIYAIPPTIRECVTFAIVFKQTNNRSLKAIWETFFNEQDTFKLCGEFIDRHAVGYKFLLVRPGEELGRKYVVNCAPEEIPAFNLAF